MTLDALWGLSKYLVIAVVPLFLYMWKRINDTYTKSESDKQVEIRLLPIKTELDHLNKSIDVNTQSNIKLTDAINDLKVEFAKGSNRQPQ